MNRFAMWLAVGAACALFAWWFLLTHERVTESEYVGYQGEARLNEFLAAELLLRHFDIESDGRPSLVPGDWLPDTSDTLVARISGTIALGEGRDLLLDWMAAGGHLILAPPVEGSQVTADFVDSLGFQYSDVDDSGVLDNDGDRDSGVIEEPDSLDYFFGPGAMRWRIEPNDDGVFEATLSNDTGIVAARREWGDGFLTVLSDAGFFMNGPIAESQHGRLLLDLVAGYVSSGKVWFIYSSDFPSLWQVLWSNARYAVICFAAAVLIWLWSIVRRFGPRSSPESLSRRSVMEHISAAGHFVCRHQNAQSLIAESSAALLQEAERRHPGISRLPMVMQARQLARITGIPDDDIQDALVSHGEPGRREFVQTIQAIHRIRKAL